MSRQSSAFLTALDGRSIEQIYEDAEAHRRSVAEAAAQAPGELEGFFGPASTIWEIAGEPLISAGAIRAVAMQILHPAVAAAGVQNSRFRLDFIGRAWRTYAAMSELVFGDLETARAASERLHTLHAMVRGVIPPEASARRAGEPYRATDPQALLWVLATLYEASARTYERLVAPLTEGRRRRYWAETRRFGALLGIPPAVIPEGLADFERYWRRTEEAELEAGPAARELVAFLRASSLSRLSRWTAALGPVTALDDAWIKASVPEAWAAALGISPSAAERRRAEALARGLRALAVAVPGRVRRVPAYHQALLRVERGAGRPGRASARAVEALNRRVRLPMSLRPVAALSGDATRVAADLAHAVGSARE